MAFKHYKGNVEASDIVSGTLDAARVPSLDNLTVPADNLDINSKRLTNVSDPTADQDAATKKFIEDSYLTSSSIASTYLTQSSASSLYLTSSSLSSYATQSFVNNLIEGVDPKELCKVATTAELTTGDGWSFSAGALTKSGSSLSIDGQSLTAGDRVLVKDQSTNPEQNGIYDFSIAGGNLRLDRSSDADSVEGLKAAYTFITDGTANAGKGFVQNTLTGSQTLNSDDVGFAQFTSVSSTLTQEQVEDFAGALVASGGTKTGITVTYQDATGDVDFVVSDTTVAGDSGSTGMTPGDTLTIAGGTGITTAMSGDTLTITASGGAQRTQEEIEDFVGAMVTGNTETNIAVTYDDTSGKLNFVATNTQLSTEEVQDIAGPLVASGGTKTGITVTYDDDNGNMDFVVSDTTIAGDSGSTGMTPGDTLTIAGGTNVTTAMSGDTLTITATDTNTQLTQEQVEDFVGAMVAGNSESGISVTYDDTNGKLDFSTTIQPSNISSYALTSSTVGNFAVSSLSGTTFEIDASASSGSVTLSLPDLKKVAVKELSSSVFLDSDHTVTQSNASQVYAYTATDNRTLTLPQVGAGASAVPVGTRFEVKLLTVASGKKLSVAYYSGDKADGSTAATELNVAGEALNFTALAASGNSTTTWMVN